MGPLRTIAGEPCPWVFAASCMLLPTENQIVDAAGKVAVAAHSADDAAARVEPPAAPRDAHHVMLAVGSVPAAFAVEMPQSSVQPAVGVPEPTHGPAM